LIFVAAVGFLTKLFRADVRPAVFASMVALMVFFGSLRIQQIAGYWSEVPPVTQRIMSAARSDLRSVPAGSSVMLDNVCPYVGPAIVLEGPWDISGALELALGRPVHGDAVSPRMWLRPTGLATSIYGEPAYYPFGEMLFVYDPARHRVVKLRNLGEARAYFAAARAGRTPCPRAYVGHGVLI
jgi:hypothetical protein